MTKANVKHHYVPQCYLRNFSPNGTSVFVYDKIESRAYSVAISNICCIDEFYTLPKGVIDIHDNERKNGLYLECDYFAQSVEPIYGRQLSDIIEKKEKWLNDKSILAISHIDKFEFAKQIAIQFLRLPENRDWVKKFRESTMPPFMDIFKELVGVIEKDNRYKDIDTNRLCAELTPDITIDHAEMLFANMQLIEDCATAIANNYWGFGVSLDNDLYTSDFPIIVYPHVSNVRPIFRGLASYGCEVTFPISSSIYLTIWEKEYFKNKSEIDCQFTYLSEKDKQRKAYYICNTFKRLLIVSNKDEFRQFRTHCNHQNL